MKRLFCAAILLAAPPLFAAGPPAAWSDAPPAAWAEPASEAPASTGLTLVVLCGSRCPACRALHAAIDGRDVGADVHAYMDNAVKDEEYAVASYPTLVLLDERGRECCRHAGAMTLAEVRAWVKGCDRAKAAGTVCVCDPATGAGCSCSVERCRCADGGPCVSAAVYGPVRPLSYGYGSAGGCPP